MTPNILYNINKLRNNAYKLEQHLQVIQESQVPEVE
jgi:hypothetical protein